jgi:hypothetical protein
MRMCIESKSTEAAKLGKEELNEHSDAPEAK